MTQLSAEQRLAVAAGPGPVRVVAGPGTGKTTVIVERFLRLVKDGLDPSRILLVTFTERAAREMRGRLEERLGTDVDLSVSTFHAMAQQWLRQDGRRLRIPSSFSIITGPWRWVLAHELLWRLADDALVAIEHPEQQIPGLLRTLERLKQELIPLRAFENAARRTPDPDVRRVHIAAARFFRAYEAECRRRRLLDFDDLLERTVRLFESDAEVLTRYQTRYPWVLVDEYQDTNLAQERIVELLAGRSGQVFVVGDDDQSIYRFRGASRASMERFGATFPAQQTLQLTRNRRSTRRIARTADRLIQHNADRVPKSVTSTRSAGAPVELWQSVDSATEATAIAAEIGRLLAAGAAPDEIAVLTRTNAMARPIAEALAAAGIPLRNGAWGGFFDQPAVKDLLAALRLLRDPMDALAGYRLAAGFGELSAESWQQLTDDLRRQVAWRDVRELLFDLLERTRYLERTDREASTARFSDLVDEYCEQSADHSLGALLDFLELVERSGLEPDARELDVVSGGVSLMTIHQAKGLEFDVVFVPSLVEGRLPQPRRRERFSIPTGLVEAAVRGREDHVAEERRLLYVALTRARERVVMSWARQYEGDRAWTRSRFVDEVLAGAGPDLRQIEIEPVTRPAERPAPAVGPPLAEPLTLTYSALAAYRECPRQHWFRYHRRLPPARTVEGHLGDAVHRALRAAAERRMADEAVTEDLVRELVEAAWSEEPFPEPKQEAVYRRLAMELTLRYLQDPEHAQAMFHVKHSELPFETALNGFRLRGVIDRIDAPAQEAAPHVLVDYKTGLPAPASRLRRDLQLALYAIGAKHELGLDAIQLRIEYLREGKTVTLDADDALLGEAERLVRELGDKIAAGRFEPNPEPRRCARCSYRLVCDASV